MSGWGGRGCATCSTESPLDSGPEATALCPDCHSTPEVSVACDVLISYASKDHEQAEKGAGLLEGDSIGHWLAPEGIGLGDSFVNEITEALGQAMVLVVSTSAVESRRALEHPVRATGRAGQERTHANRRQFGGSEDRASGTSVEGRAPEARRPQPNSIRWPAPTMPAICR